MKTRSVILSLLLILISSFTYGQKLVFTFPEYHANTSWQPCDYNVNVRVSIVGVEILQPYSDEYPKNEGSFPVKLYIQFENNVDGKLVPSGNFYQYQLTMISGDSTFANITNHIGGLPLADSVNYKYTLDNNPTKKGSLKLLGLEPGYYTDAKVINLFPMSKMLLTVNAPCFEKAVELESITVPQYSFDIDIQQFKLVQNNQHNDITFTINNIDEVQNIVVEKSINGTQWNTFQNVAINTAENTYQVTDFNINGTIYYRLKITDINNEVFYSNIIKSIAKYDNNSTIKVYPNPTSGMLYIDNVLENTTINIIDKLGKTVLTSKVHQATATHSINVSSLTSDIYMLMIHDDNNSTTQKITIL